MHSASRAFAAALLAVIALPVTAMAQAASDYPNKSVRLIVSAAAGGGNDLIARIVAQNLQPKWKQSIVVENKGGAGTLIGTAFEVVLTKPAGSASFTT